MRALTGRCSYLCAAICLVLGIASVRASEPAEDFLKALRDKGFHDVALDYLDQMGASPLCPVAFKRIIPYERALTLVDLANIEFEPAAREALLDKAKQSLDAFLQESANHPLAFAARNQLGNLLYMRARLQIDLAKRNNNDPARLAKAREFFDQAYDVFAKAQEELHKLLEPINSRQYDPSQRAEEELRDQMRSDYLQSQLLAAQVMEERADTARPGSPEFLQMLQDAEKKYKDIEEKYHRMIARPMASLGRGRCLKKMAKLQEALGFFGELLEQADTPEFRAIKTDALQLAMDCWLDPSIKLYAEAVNRGTLWEETLRPLERREPQPLLILFQLARANKLYADYLEEKDPGNRQSGELLRMARKLASEVSRSPGAAQETARQLLADLRGVEAEPQERPNPKTFEEAKLAAKDAMDQMENAAFLADALPERLAAETEAQIKAELEKQLQEAKENVVAKRQDAIEFFRQALALRNAETPVEELNLVRMTLAHLLFLEDSYYDAAVLAEFVARRYPAHGAARDAARVALAAYVHAYTSAPEDDREFEGRRVRDLADYIVNQWPDQPVAADAWNALIPFIVIDGDFERALAGVAKVPPSAPQRGEIELKIGRALWGAYRQGMAELRRWEREGIPAGVDIAQKKSQLEQWKGQAETILAAGVERVRSASSAIDPSLMLATIALAQIYVETQQPQKAVTLLEDPQIGPLPLVRAQHPATTGQGVSEEIYRTCLRAYLGLVAAGDTSDAAIDKAKGLMEELKAYVANDPAAQQRLITVYIGLVRDLKGQMDIASDDERKALARGFEVFLSQVARETTDFQVLHWAAETFFNLAESFDDPTAMTATAAADSLYKQALAIYQRILEEAAKQEGYLPSAQFDLLVRMRTAMINRRIGKFELAMETFVKLLTEKNMMLNVQVEAARTFQMWASFPGKHELYQRAMLGHYPSGTANIVWGWGKIGKLTSGRADFTSIFFDARYNLAVCRFEYGKRTTNEETREQYLKLAKQDIWFTYKFSAEMGGAEWRPKFDALLKEIQTARKEQPVGLVEFEQQDKETQTSQR